MANQEQLDLLKQGSTVWYAWRKQHPSLQPDLSGAHLTRAWLRGAERSGADFSNTKLNEKTLITKEQIGQAKPGTHA